MKKTIKSVLIGALVALLGSSAWAAAAQSRYVLSLGGFATGVLDDPYNCNTTDGAGGYCTTYELCNDLSSVASLVELMKQGNNNQSTACAWGQFVIQYNPILTLRLTQSKAKEGGDYNLRTILPAWFLR